MVILDMLQDMNADNGVEAIRKKRCSRQVHFDRYVGTVGDIPPHIKEVAQFF
jgi:hypothetical protein